MDGAPAPAEPRTEAILFNPLKFQRNEALEHIVLVARSLGVQVESIEERKRRLSIDVRVTVTAEPSTIRAFKDAVVGREIVPQGPADGLISVGVGLLRSGAEWLVQDFNW